MIVIDGSEGEGGGQVLRTSLTLSAATGQPFLIKKIRAARPKPGLMRQHLTAVCAVAEICEAHGLNGPKSATALVIACAFLINETRQVLPPAVGAAIALETMIAVARMAPVTEEQPDRRAG